jgi:osmotically-inducible protein OsmY
MKYVTRSLSTVVCLLTMITLMGCAGNRYRESTGEYVDDSTITAKVKAALVADPVVKAAEVNVETFKHVVQLSGFVDSKEQEERAIQVARGVRGVKEVRSSLIVK